MKITFEQSTIENARQAKRALLIQEYIISLLAVVCFMALLAAVYIIVI